MISLQRFQTLSNILAKNGLEVMRNTTLKLQNGLLSEKKKSHSESLGPPITFSWGRDDTTYSHTAARSQDDATTPLCFGSLIKELESRHELLQLSIL